MWSRILGRGGSEFELGIDSNLLHSLSTSICIKKCNKNLG